MRNLLIPVALATLAAPPVAAHPGPERHPAWVGEPVIFDSPIAGIRNDWWDDYRSDIAEADSELRKDLRRATDAEDRREAWGEWKREIEDAASDYAGEMADRGYRSGIVTIGRRR